MAGVRLFTAVELSEDSREILRGLLLKAAAYSKDVKWAQPQQLHVTLAFLGEQPEERISPMVQSLRRLGRSLKSFEMELGGMGAFPNLNRPKVLFVPVTVGMGKMSQLAGSICSEAHALGMSLESRDYHAHATLGRVRKYGTPGPAAQWLQGACPARMKPQLVDRFALIQSHLTSKGADYQTLAEFPLEAQGNP